MNRFSIALAYWAYMALWNEGGVTNRDLKKNRILSNGQMDTISGQLHRMGFKLPVNFSTDHTAWDDPVMEATCWRLVAKFEIGAVIEGDPLAQISHQSFLMEAPMTMQ